MVLLENNFGAYLFANMTHALRLKIIRLCLTQWSTIFLVCTAAIAGTFSFLVNLIEIRNRCWDEKEWYSTRLFICRGYVTDSSIFSCLGSYTVHNLTGTNRFTVNLNETSGKTCFKVFSEQESVWNPFARSCTHMSAPREILLYLWICASFDPCPRRDRIVQCACSIHLWHDCLWWYGISLSFSFSFLLSFWFLSSFLPYSCCYC